MMTKTERKQEPSALRKLALPMIIGGIVGFAGVLSVDRVIDGELIGGLPQTAEIAVLVGAFYVIMAVGVGLGAAFPSVGSKFLNVEDAEELQEQRVMLLYSAVAMTLLGIALVALALGGEGGVLSSGVSLTVTVLAFLAGGGVAVLSYRKSDELMLAVNVEATVVTYILMLFGMGGWAMFAHLGYARVPNPLDWITSFYVLMLVGTFAAAGRRGMLNVK